MGTLADHERNFGWLNTERVNERDCCVESNSNHALHPRHTYAHGSGHCCLRCRIAPSKPRAEHKGTWADHERIFGWLNIKRANKLDCCSLSGISTHANHSRVAARR